MAQFGERLALAAGLVLRNGKVVMSAMSSPKKSDGLSSGSPSATPSQGPAIVADEPGQADFVADGQASSSPARLCGGCERLLHAWEEAGVPQSRSSHLRSLSRASHRRDRSDRN